MDIKIALYCTGHYYLCSSEGQVLWHVSRGARIAHIKIDFDELPPVQAIFGEGLVTNRIVASGDIKGETE